MSFNKRLIPRVMTALTQRKRAGSQMKAAFQISLRPLLVNDMTCVAPHIKGFVPAAVRRNVQPLIVAFEAKVFLLSASERFAQMVLVRGGMGIVAKGAIPPNRRMQHLARAGLLVRVAFQA
jgi:hypothetical protein